MRRRYFYLITVLPLLIVLTGLLSNCASASQTHDTRTVTVAIVENNPLNEDGSINRQSIYAGALLAADQIRARGGIDIQIDAYDDDNDPQKSLEIANQIADSGALAVIGHTSAETLEAGGNVYEAAGIPTLNVSAISGHFTESYYYHFNLSYTAEAEAAYLANYLRKVNGTQTATIISTRDGYSTSLAKQFKNTFQGLEGIITIEKVVGDETADEIVSDIISANTETHHPGVIFIATDDITAAELLILMKRKGVSYPVAGGSALSSPAFRAVIESQQEEVTFPGYYTDGILTVREIVFDSANRYANDFLTDYQQVYQSDNSAQQPGDEVVNGYDALLTLLTAMQRAEVDGSASHVAENREQIYNELVNMDSVESGVQGISGFIYFEPSQNIRRAPRFGLYQNGEIISANIQFEPVISPGEIDDLAEQVENGRIVTLNGDYVYQSNVVYAGIDLLGIDDIDIKTSTYKLDFYLWFRYRPNELDEAFKPEDFLFTNAQSEPEITLLRAEENGDGTVLKTYRVVGTFKEQFQFHNYPFDRQVLSLEFRNQSATTSFIQYVVDRVGMRFENEEELLDNYRDNGAFDAVFGWDETSVSMSQDIFPTTSTLGSPENFDSRIATNYSLINLEIELRRDSLQYIIKSLLPLLITLVLAYITFFLPLGHSERLAVGSTALLTTAFFHLALADALPEIGYTVAMEFLFYASYGMSALIVLLETLSSRLEKQIEEKKKKADKKKLTDQRHDLDMFGRILYPTILLATLGIGFFVYNGTLRLGPQRQVVSSNLPDTLVEAPTPAGQFAATSTPAPVSDEIVLTLSTWRPEDSEEMEVILNEFEEYALATTGRKVIVNYRPLMSVNYDSILDLQLSSGAGPDLMYVRPFSVNGNIIRYLLPLDGEIALEQNFEKTKLIPWTNSSFELTYAMPFVGVAQGVYYNKDIFDKYFLEVPETWEDFRLTANALKLADESLIPIANALNQSEDSEMFMSIAANFLGGPEGREKYMRTDGTSLCYNDASIVRAFQAIEDLKPYLPENAARINSQTSKELFLQGNAAMLFGGSWDLQKISNEADFNWDVFAVPASFVQRTYVIFQPDIGIGINRATPHPDEAKLLLEWLMTREAVNLTSEKLPGFYPLGTTQVTRSSDPNDEKFLTLVNDYPADIRWMYTEISNKTPSALEIVRQSLYEIAALDLPAQAAADRLQAGLGEWYEPAQNCK